MLNPEVTDADEGGMSFTDLHSVTGVGPALAARLVDAGYADRDALARASVGDLVSLKGVGPVRAATLIAAASTSEEPNEDATDDQGPTGSKRPIDNRAKRLRSRHASLKSRERKARRKAKKASSKKKRKRWTAEADRLAKKRKKAKRRLKASL